MQKENYDNRSTQILKRDYYTKPTPTHYKHVNFVYSVSQFSVLQCMDIIVWIPLHCCEYSGLPLHRRQTHIVVFYHICDEVNDDDDFKLNQSLYLPIIMEAV